MMIFYCLTSLSFIWFLFSKVYVKTEVDTAYGSGVATLAASAPCRKHPNDLAPKRGYMPSSVLALAAAERDGVRGFQLQGEIKVEFYGEDQRAALFSGLSSHFVVFFFYCRLLYLQL